MKRGATFYLALVAVLLIASDTFAGSIKLVDGGPDKPENRHKVVNTLIGAGKKLSRCLRGHAQVVRINLKVRRSGRTHRAMPTVRSRAAKCVARVIRHTRFRWTRRAWSGVVELSAASPNDTGRRDMSTLSSDLAPTRAQINACARRYRVSGRARFSFVITGSGQLQKPRIDSSRGVKSPARACMIGVLRKSSVRSQAGARPVTFRLSLSFANRGGQLARPSRRSAKGLQPKKFGPLASSSISKVMFAKRARFQRCYARHSRPGLKGDVVMRFTVRSNGTVRNVKIRKTTLKHKRVERCIIAVGKTLVFPGEKGRGTTRVFYPFRFGG